MITAGIACRPLAQRRVRGTGRKYCAARSRVNGGVLAGVLIGTHHAAAQAQEACPLPAGATGVEPLDVTAPQVENAPNLLRDFALSVSARLAYGIGDTWGSEGVLTPYTDVSLSDAGSRRLSLGGRYDIGPWVGMSLEGVHGRPAQGAAAHSVMLRADLRW